MNYSNVSLVPKYRIVKEIACPIEHVTLALGKSMYNRGAKNPPPGSACGSINENRFRLEFVHRSRNSFRPEFKGSYFVRNGRVVIVVKCGLAAEVNVFSLAMSILMIFSLCVSVVKWISGNRPLSSFLSLCVFAAGILATPWIFFWSEFQVDKLRTNAILDRIGHENKTP